MSRTLFKLTLATLMFFIGIFAVRILETTNSSFCYYAVLNTSALNENPREKLIIPASTTPAASLVNKENFREIKMSELKINDIGLDSSYSKVLRQLGNPIKIEKGEFDNCADAKSKRLYYKGIEVYLIQIDNKKNYKITSINFSSSKWSVFEEIKIGASISDVISKFGQPTSKSIKAELNYFYYSNDDGGISFTFRNNKLVAINWEYSLC